MNRSIERFSQKLMVIAVNLRPVGSFCIDIAISFALVCFGVLVLVAAYHMT